MRLKTFIVLLRTIDFIFDINFSIESWLRVHEKNDLIQMYIDEQTGK